MIDVRSRVFTERPDLRVRGDTDDPQLTQSTYQPQIMAFVRAFFLFVAPASVVALMLAFFPPRAYLARLRRPDEEAAPS